MLIAELKYYQKMLSAIDKSDQAKLIRLLFCANPIQWDNNCERYLSRQDWRQFLDARDSQGKTLLTIIKQSNLDFNKKKTVYYFEDCYEFTPLEEAIFFLSRQSIVSKDQIHQIYLLLALGANVNFINGEGDNILHFYVRKLHILPLILKTFILAGADIYLKNKSGKSPLELAKPTVARFMLTIAHQNIITIQRKWRAKHNQTPAVKSSTQLNHPSLNHHNPPKNPKPNPPDKSKMNLWVNKHDQNEQETAKQVVNSINYISFQHFLFGLKKATEKFNRFLLTLPKTERNYVLLVDNRQDKSGSWVTKLAESYLSLPPDIILDFSEFIGFSAIDNMKHIVLFDDASYSGNFMYDTVEYFYEQAKAKYHQLMDLTLHLVVPFTTEKSRNRLKEFDVVLHTQETIAPFQVKGTKFYASTATFFDHKIPCDISSIECIKNGKLINGKESGVKFVADNTPPYKR